LDKAPDAFRTISEVADELDIPQHVLRFWETRFAQIKPMKRSGGRRYYRPDDVDLLKGIRRLLYGEGYTIRGVQRILKEHGIKSVQGIADQTAAISFGAVEEAVGHSMAEPDDAELNDGIDLDGEEGDGDEGGIDYRFVDPDEDPILSTYKARAQQPAKTPDKARDKSLDKAPAAPVRAAVAAADRERLERALGELVACRQMIDAAMKDG
jgi:DNA-binding transcriptional MerR regulator